MHVRSIGLTPVKGGRHTAYAALDLDTSGPVGDRVFCLIDPAARRVLRTVEHPALLTLSWRWSHGVLRMDGPGGTIEAAPVLGDRIVVDYWGRPAEVSLVDGPWSAACARLLGRDVALARAEAGDVVYGDAVTIVTTSSLDGLVALLDASDLPLGGGEAAAGADLLFDRFRATLLIDTGHVVASEYASEHASEHAWVGATLHVGSAVLRVTGTVPRCAVIDLDPLTGRRDLPVLRTLVADQRPAAGAEPRFGLQAQVERPGRVAAGDRADFR